jgi:hypothetical protein
MRKLIVVYKIELDFKNFVFTGILYAAILIACFATSSDTPRIS